MCIGYTTVARKDKRFQYVLVLMVLYSHHMTKKTQKNKTPQAPGDRLKYVIIPLLGLIAIGAIVLTVLAVITMPNADKSAQRGVGANGFRAYEEQGADLGISKVASHDQVVAALGAKAKSVGTLDVSGVFNFDGTRGQTATYPFIKANGNDASLYVDLMFFKNTATLDAANIYENTISAGSVNGHPAYYMHAQTFGSDREYRLLVVNGLKAYKFVIVQPYRDISISEVSALAALKTLAAKAKL